MCIGLHTLPPCLLFCGNYILHESEYDVHIFCVALDIIIYPGVPATCLGATPKARMLWLLAKSFARCKTSRASNAKHPFLDNDRGFSTDWPLPRGEGLCMLSWLCIVQSIWAYTPGIRAGAILLGLPPLVQARMLAVGHTKPLCKDA